MYLHIGGDTAVPTADILFIGDLDNASYSRLTRDTLRRAEKEGRVINVAEDLPKSFVICQRGEKPSVVFLSQLNSATLLKRAGSGFFESLGGTEG